MQSFYILQRKRMKILIENGKPSGGKWSYDEENRKSIPKKHTLPSIKLEKPNSYTEEAIVYVKKHFNHHVGLVDCYLPIDYEGCLAWLDEFLNDRLESFGIYEDAIIPSESFLYHSILSPMLNIGLITPQDIVDKTLTFAKKHKTPLNSLEGFLRQIIGWREFMKMSYDLNGEKMRKANFFHHKKKIPQTYWN
jgi:deoxyribodipyrimidine photolyase-related protein